MTDINLNQAECLKEINHLGKNVYQNVCDGTFTSVSWGSMDWICLLFVGGILVVGILVVGIVAFISVIRN